jgi:hypothetical protein
MLLLFLACLLSTLAASADFPDINIPSGGVDKKFFYVQMHAGNLTEGDGKVGLSNTTSYQYMDVLVSNGTLPEIHDVLEEFPSFKLGLNMQVGQI